MDNIDDISKVTEELEIAELELAQNSKNYQQLSATLEKPNINHEVREKLPSNSAIIEFKVYIPIDFSNGQRVSPGGHYAAFLLTKDKIIFKDLGLVEKSRVILRKKRYLLEILDKLKTLTDKESKTKYLAEIHQNLAEYYQNLGDGAFEEYTKYIVKEYDAKLYQNLFGAFDEHLKEFDNVYIAPDLFLNLIPFSALILPDGRYWLERQTLRQLQTGRDLLRKKPTPSSDFLLAIGGVDFETHPAQAMRESSNNTRGLVEGVEFFGDLPAPSREEVQDITKYLSESEHLKNWNVKDWKGSEASEGHLKSLTQVPRVLHFATHAFYNERSTDNNNMIRPLTLSGIALAGANLGLEGELDSDGEDGIFYSLEALNLNLEGTELVVFSACDIGKGVLDISGGVYGLVRAFKIAGAYRILMTLWEVDNKFSKDFMIKFYKNWQKNQDDPAKVLRETQLYYIKESPTQNITEHWGAYVVVGP